MTSVTSTLRGSASRLLSRVAVRSRSEVSVEVQPLTAAQQVVRAVLILLAVATSSLVLQLVVVSPFQARAAQQKAFDRFRQQAAAGTAPLAAGDLKGKKGQPVAFLEVPAIGLKQVIIEGTDAGDLFKGPGHRRDTPLPGQSGTSVLLGRRAAFGGPFAHLSELQKKDVVRVTTGAGVFEYRVVGVRRSGDPAPTELGSTAGRVALVTADGAPYVPAGVLIVDADLTVPGLGGKGPLLNASTLPNGEKLLGIDLSTLWRLILWLQVLLAAVLAVVFSWHRWHRAKTWVVFLPVLMLVGLFTAGEAARLLPNLL